MLHLNSHLLKVLAEFQDLRNGKRPRELELVQDEKLTDNTTVVDLKRTMKRQLAFQLPS